MTYDFTCSSKHEWVVNCSIHEDANPVCPKCGQTGWKFYTAVEVQFPGSWWGKTLDDGVRSGAIDKRSKFSNKVKVPKRYLDEARAAGVKIN